MCRNYFAENYFDNFKRKTIFFAQYKFLTHQKPLCDEISQIDFKKMVSRDSQSYVSEKPFKSMGGKYLKFSFSSVKYSMKPDETAHMNLKLFTLILKHVSTAKI
jgi:hypothetical protein